MKQNTKITVLARDSDHETYVAERLRGYDWTHISGTLAVYAWRGGIRTKVAEYVAGTWRSVRFDNAIVTITSMGPQPTLKEPVEWAPPEPVASRFGQYDADYTGTEGGERS
jgi:hypothetical protein